MTMMTTPIRFGAWEGTAYYYEHTWWVPAKPIAEYLGLSWRRQRRILQGSHVISVGAFRAPAADGKTYEMLMLSTDDIGLWLIQISPQNVSDETRTMLLEMQRHLRAAIKTQISETFGIPSPGDLADLLEAPMPADLADEPRLRAMVTQLRAEKLAEPGVARAALMFKLGLPGTKVGALLGRSAYWANKRRRMLVDLFVLEPRRAAPLAPAANDAAGQIDLFATERNQPC